MTKRCGGCKHWGTSVETTRREVFRSCQAIVHTSPLCWDGYIGEPIPDDLVAGTVDGSDYMSALKGREDFGCVLWETA